MSEQHETKNIQPVISSNEVIQYISSDPTEVKSHFAIVEQANRKGQARYRCIMCHHEFSCTGKLRLVQHIVGIEFAGSNFKNVKACPNPYMPLKQSLLEKRMQDEENIVKVLTEMKDSNNMSISDSENETAGFPRSKQATSNVALMLENMKDCTLTKNSAAFLIATAASSLDSMDKEEEEPEGTQGALEKKRPLSSSSDALTESEEPSLSLDAVPVRSSTSPTMKNINGASLPAVKRPIKKRKSEPKLETQQPLTMPPTNTHTSTTTLSTAATNAAINSAYVNSVLQAVPQSPKDLPPVTGKLTLDRLLSIFHIVHQISPQVLESAILIQNLKENQSCPDIITTINPSSSASSAAGTVSGSDEVHLPAHISSLLNPYGSKKVANGGMYGLSLLSASSSTAMALPTPPVMPNGVNGFHSNKNGIHVPSTSSSRAQTPALASSLSNPDFSANLHNKLYKI